MILLLRIPCKPGAVKKRIASYNLKLRVLKTGIVSGKVGVAYLEGAVQPELLAELTCRIERLKVDGVVGTGQLERLVRISVTFSTVSGDGKAG